MSGPAYPFALRASFSSSFINENSFTGESNSIEKTTDTYSTCVSSSILPFFIAFLSNIDKYSGFFST